MPPIFPKLLDLADTLICSSLVSSSPLFRPYNVINLVHNWMQFNYIINGLHLLGTHDIHALILGRAITGLQTFA